MSQIRETWFISDLHLDPASPHTTKLFFATLDSVKQAPVDALYILGDLFEVWIGDDDINEFSQAVLSRLNDINKAGIPVYFLCGNRDFLIGKKFLKQSGCKLLPEQIQIDVYGEAVLLMHGDTLCTQDLAYIKARKWLRNPLIKGAFLTLPLRLRKRIAKKLRQQSKNHVSQLSMDVMDVTEDAVHTVMRERQVKFLIHGHTHKPAIFQFETKDPAFSFKPINKTRIVLGAWHDKASILIWDSLGNKKLQDFDS